MAKPITRQEIKRNELRYQLERALLWMKAHREGTLGIGLILFIGILLILYFISRYAMAKKTAWERLAIAQSHALTGQHESALNLFQVISQQFQKTEVAHLSLLYQGNLLYRTGKFEQAEAVYQESLQKKTFRNFLPLALAGLAAAQEAQGKHETALQNYRRLVDEFGDHFLAPQAHLGIGRCLQMQGKNREAAEVYQKIPLLYPETAWAQTAQQLLGQKK